MNKKIIIGTLGIGLLWLLLRHNPANADEWAEEKAACALNEPGLLWGIDKATGLPLPRPAGVWDDVLHECVPPGAKVTAGPLGMGDIDMDGWVSEWDYMLIQQYRFGQVDFTDEQFRRADINHDGEISLMDYSGCRLIQWGQKVAE